MVYTASSLSLAAMEILVHLDSDEILNRYVCIPIEFPSKLSLLFNQQTLPKNWRNRVAPLHILPGYCSIDRAGTLPQLILNQTSGSPLLRVQGWCAMPPNSLVRYLFRDSRRVVEVDVRDDQVCARIGECQAVAATDPAAPARHEPDLPFETVHNPFLVFMKKSALSDFFN